VHGELARRIVVNTCHAPNGARFCVDPATDRQSRQNFNHVILRREEVRSSVDFGQLVKDAAFVGLAAGTVVMAAVVLYCLARYYLRPAITVAAATAAAAPSVGFGF